MNEKERALRHSTWRRSHKRQAHAIIERPHERASYCKKGETWEHYQAKCKLVWEHVQLGHACTTEAQIISSGDVPDFRCLECGDYEIIATHGDEEEYKRKGRTVIRV